ncbi:YigZ family protein [Shewanella sp. C32]|uniref:YigZ family protein n=1 Tax=Shewanella electrica TaxID=515560 RepID=A0ABT2FPA7_9GAMM|nr:YigZ family protein [Shewanella electrica]MCH1926539.1 YigZ family protein [Shewanella electrica]MCS4558160.1 YigZ family protein [Shewanella electrica]
MSHQYFVLAAAVRVEEEVKGSKFITVLFNATDQQDFRNQLQLVKQEYPGANHYCQAFVISAPGDNAVVGFSDDGEPAGSAGRPMLNVLVGAQLGYCGAVVVRYFGGTKLGVGGLVRAYAGGVKLALSQASLLTREPTETITLHCQYSELGSVEHFCQKQQLLIEDKQFAEQVTLKIQLPLSSIEPLCEQLNAIHPVAITIIRNSANIRR